MKHILAFAGSNSSKSINKQLAAYASSIINDVEVELLDLNDYEVPIYSTDREANDGHPEKAVDFVNKIKNADGIVVSLAEYNGAYTSAFKNIFDWMSRVEQKTFMGKPMLLMAASPGGRGGQSVLEMAHDRFPRHNANVVGKFSLPFFNENFKDGKISNTELNDQLVEEVQQFENSL